jgi:hypothetical protein
MLADGAPTLVAAAVKAQLLEALAPAWAGLLGDLQSNASTIEHERVLFMIQLAPARCRVVVEAREPEPARELVSAPLPSSNPVAIAARDYLAGVLSAHDDGAADRALDFVNAFRCGRRVGGLFVLVRPTTGETRAFLAKDGADLGESIDLGGIVGRMTAN